MIRWLLMGEGVKDPPSIDAILGKEHEDELTVEGLSALLKRINNSGKWDA